MRQNKTRVVTSRSFPVPVGTFWASALSRNRNSDITNELALSAALPTFDLQTTVLLANIDLHRSPPLPVAPSPCIEGCLHSQKRDVLPFQASQLLYVELGADHLLRSFRFSPNLAPPLFRQAMLTSHANRRRTRFSSEIYCRASEEQL